MRDHPTRIPCLLATCLVAASLLSSPAVAQDVVDQRFTGTLVSVETTPPGAVTRFVPGQPVTVTWRVDRGSFPQILTLHSCLYSNAILALDLSVGTTTAHKPAAGAGTIGIGDGVRGMFNGQLSYIDYFDAKIPELVADNAPDLSLSNLQLDFVEGDHVLAGLEIPLGFNHDLGFHLDFDDNGVPGHLEGIVGPPAIPALPMSWGRVKSLYAR
jgi:hypothetical protein